MKFIKSIIFIIFLIFISQVAWSATYYVDQNNAKANDNNPGTESSPWKTIQKGINMAQAGDTVYVKEAVYYETVDTVRSGSNGSPITFQNYPGHNPILDGSKSGDNYVVYLLNKDYIAWNGIDIRNGQKVGIWFEGDHNTIEHCAVYNNGVPNGSYDSGIIMKNSEYGHINDVEVYGNGRNGISVTYSNYCTIEYCYAHDNLYHNGIQIFRADVSSEYSHHNIVRYNISKHNYGGFLSWYNQYAKIYNNLIIDSIHYGMQITTGNLGGPSPYSAYSKIYNNTITNSGGHGMLITSTRDLAIKNNILANNNYEDIYMTSTTGHDIDYNLYYGSPSWRWGGNNYSSLSSWQSASSQDVHSFLDNPGFVDADGEDYSLQSSSSAINKGVNLTSEGITDDINGTSRPQGGDFDIGAYEYVTDTPDSPVELIPPENLRVVN